MLRGKKRYKYNKINPVKPARLKECHFEAIQRKQQQRELDAHTYIVSVVYNSTMERKIHNCLFSQRISVIFRVNPPLPEVWSSLAHFHVLIQ